MRLKLLILAMCAPVSAGLAQAEWTLGTKPIVDIAGINANGDVVFQNLGGATRLSNGNFLVADRGTTSVRLIDPAGKVLKSFGREGRGPGEYAMIISANGCGPDSLVVWTRDSSVMVGTGGTAARTFRLPADSNRIFQGFNVSCSTTGRVAFLTQPTSRVQGSSPSMFVMGGRAVITDRAGKIQSMIDSIPMGEWMGVGGGGFPRPLGPTTSLVTIGDAVVIGVSDSARVWVYKNGQRTRVAVPAVSRAPTREEFEGGVNAVADMAPVPLRPRLLPELMKAEVPKQLPPFFGLFSDPTGVLWVQQSPPGAKRTDLLGIDLAGNVGAHLRIPMALTIYEIGEDYILGSYEDANDETHLAVLGLRRR